MTALPPFAAWVGPQRPKMLIVGEAWGEQEEACRQAFVGSSGQELWRMLGEATPGGTEQDGWIRGAKAQRYGNAWIGSRREWMEEQGIAFTNVFALRPLGNKIESLCETKKENKGASPADQLARGLYLKKEYSGELLRLADEIRAARPNLLLPMGNTAAWAVLRSSAIGSIRGTVASGHPAGVAPEYKVLPTYHPAGVLRQWSWRLIVVADLMKAQREKETQEIVRPRRQVIINPTLGEVQWWWQQLVDQPPAGLAVDIETGNRQIKCIGFARDRANALVVPFVDLTKPEGSYWPTATAELEAWNLVRWILEFPVPKIFQNGVYDLQYILQLGLRPTQCLHDTMLRHHSLFPELQKGLGFLGSIYTNEASWKLMNRKKNAEQMEKADE